MDLIKALKYLAQTLNFWFPYETRSTRSARTPSRLDRGACKAYSGVKQSSQLLLVSISWKFQEYPPSLRYVTNKHGYKTQKNKSYIQEVKQNIPKMFQVVPCARANKSWQFHENLFIYFLVILIRNTLRCLDGRPWNSEGRRERVYTIITWVVPDISWTFYENLFTCFFP